MNAHGIETVAVYKQIGFKLIGCSRYAVRVPALGTDTRVYVRGSSWSSAMYGHSINSLGLSVFKNILHAKETRKITSFFYKFYSDII